MSAENQEVEKSNNYLQDNIDVPLEYEVTDLRTINQKHYKKADGTYEMVIYNQEVHYFDNGKWLDIDNRLLDKGDKLATKSNMFNLSFPKNLANDKEIELKMDKYQISWSLPGINCTKASPGLEKSTTSNINELTNVTEEINYKNVLNNVDIQYIVDGTKVKENIILHEYVKDFSLSFEYKLKDLQLTTNEADKIIFINDDKETVFTFSDFFMFDKAQIKSTDINVKYENQSKGSYIITITPSDKWLRTATYPVVVDPTLRVYGYGSNDFIDDKYVFGSSGESHHEFYFITGNYDNTKTKGYYFLSIPSNYQTSYVLLNLYRISGSASTIEFKDVVITDDNIRQQFYDINGYNSETTYDSVIDYRFFVKWCW